MWAKVMYYNLLIGGASNFITLSAMATQGSYKEQVSVTIYNTFFHTTGLLLYKEVAHKEM